MASACSESSGSSGESAAPAPNAAEVKWICAAESGTAARAELAAREAEHHDAVNALRADVAQRVSDIERARTQLALAVKAILPQARATLASATAGYQVGRVPFATVVDAQASVFNFETAYYQALTDFAKALADLEQMVGAEVLR